MMQTRHIPYHKSLRFLAAILGVCVILVAHADNTYAQEREGDRFGIRLGVWPQPAVDGSFGIVRNVRVVDTLGREKSFDLDARVQEQSAIAPFIEIYGDFHLGGFWWVEGSLGWAMRWNVQVDGVRDSADFLDFIAGDRILLGQGRVVFIPLFLGVRAVKNLGPRLRPHNIYVRSGLSLVFASETPSDNVHPDVQNVFSPGSEGAPGLLFAVGGEYYYRPKYALTADLSLRYSQFAYARNAEFNITSVWISVGFMLRTR